MNSESRDLALSAVSNTGSTKMGLSFTSEGRGFQEELGGGQGMVCHVCRSFSTITYDDEARDIKLCRVCIHQNEKAWAAEAERKPSRRA